MATGVFTGSSAAFKDYGRFKICGGYLVAFEERYW